MWAWSLGREYPLKEEMASCSSILAWRIPEEPGNLQSIGPQRVGHDWSDLASEGTVFHLFIYVPNVMGLWCKTKDSTTAQGPVCYQVMKKWCGTCRRWWTTGGSGHLLCNMTLHCHEEHIENNTAELNWNETRTWQLSGMPSSTSLKMGLVSRLQSGEDYKSLEE